ncbi:cystathionine gamma-synthase family protein [Alteromonas sp. C1M14]|uniref:cystathionine gamma-synthase family protein n=1 Tax=Alteromonas sp. C1M14 TaxID=2841567 RepID=UPI001C090288|nr:cystathionine gamma-synthase family protein [Alteromonas sp. C1M14]
MSKQGFTTRQVHADRLLNHPEHGAIHTGTTNSVLFAFEDVQGLIDVFQGKQAGHVYSRSSSGSVVALQTMLSELESGIGGVCFATGMAAISSTFLSLLKAGDHIIVSQYLFGNTRCLMDTLCDLGIQISFADVTSVEEVKAVYQPNTRMVFTETVANPVTQVADVRAIGQFCAEKNVLFILDNTMTPPPLFSAQETGASLVVTSLTKYVSGHGNVLGGVVVDLGNYDWQSYPNISDGYKVADTTQWGLTQIKKKGLRDMGATLAPGSAHAIATGLETLALRMARNCHNAMELATFLHNHPKVAHVYYPGLADHPQHFIARDILDNGYGAILSLDLAEDIDVREFLNALALVISATHLGDNRTLALPVASTIFFENGPQERAKMGISEGMIRLSIGIEDTQDLIADFAQALDQFGN